jgi:glycosyltransferase involved in cell wall biosynthesis
MGDIKLKIAYFQQDGLVTGSAISLRHFLNAMNRDLFEPIVILAKEGPARQLYEELNIKVNVFHFDTFWTFPGPRCLSRDMIKQMQALIPSEKLKNYITTEIKPDLIHINDKASLNVGLSMKKTGIPIIQHSRSSYHITTCKLAKYLSVKAIKKYANQIICISEDEEDGFEQVSNKTIIYNTVDFDIVKHAEQNRMQIRESLDIKPSEFLVGFAANVTEKKGAWHFLELCKKLAHLKNVKFMMVGQLNEQGKTYIGNGEYLNMSPKEYVESFIETNQLQNRFVVTGFRKDNLDLIAAMDLLIVPNKNGVLGRQPIEAQAIGTPVIAQDGHSRKSKIILNNETGYLVKNIDEAIDKANEIILNNTAQRMAKAAKIHAGLYFSPQKNMQRIEQLYLNLTQECGH